MYKPWTTIRRLMALVIIVGVVIWVSLAAERTRSNKARGHIHVQPECNPTDPRCEFSMTREWVPFWPVYWRTFLGLPWDWHLVCVPGDGPRDIACAHDFPQMILVDDHDEKGTATGFDYMLFRAVLDGKQPSRR